MRIKELRRICGDVGAHTTLGTLANSDNIDVRVYVSKCYRKNPFVTADTQLGEIELLCGWQLCPWELQFLHEEQPD